MQLTVGIEEQSWVGGFGELKERKFANRQLLSTTMLINTSSPQPQSILAHFIS